MVGYQCGIYCMFWYCVVVVNVFYFNMQCIGGGYYCFVVQVDFV